MELALDKFKEKMGEADVLVVDTRPAAEFTQAFIPGSLFLGAEGNLEEYARQLGIEKKELLLVNGDGQEKEITDRLKKSGFKIAGFLGGGFATWQNAGEPIDMIIDVEPDELAMDLKHDQHLRILDVRTNTEFADGHVAEAENIPLQDMTDPDVFGSIEDNDNLYIHCRSGYRSLVAASLLKQQGFHNLRNVLGGFEKIKTEKGFKIDKNKEMLN